MNKLNKLILLLIFIIIISCDTRDNEPFEGCEHQSDPCFKKFIVGWDYAVWDIKNEKWIKMDFLYKFSSSRFSWNGSQLITSENTIFTCIIGNHFPKHILDIDKGFIEIKDPLIKLDFNLFFFQDFQPYNNKILLFYYSMELKKSLFCVKDESNTIIKELKFNEKDSIYQIIPGNKHCFFKFRNHNKLKEFDFITETVKDTDLDTSIFEYEVIALSPTNANFKLLNNYYIHTDELTYISFKDIYTNIEYKFNITVDLKLFYDLNNIGYYNGKFYFSGWTFESFQGIPIDDNSLIIVENNNFNIISVSRYISDIIVVKGKYLYCSMSSEFENGHFTSMLRRIDLDTYEEFDMWGGLCCGCDDIIPDIRDIAATNDYIVVSGDFCKAGVK